MKYLKIIIPIVIVLLSVGWGYSKLKSNKVIIDEKAQQTEVISTEIPVATTVVQSIKHDNNLSLIGTFEARKEINVIAEMQGRITQLLISEGQVISKGQTIATIDAATLQSKLSTAQAAFQKSEKDVERYKNLLDVGAISQTQYEEIKLGMQNQQSNLTALEEQLKYASAKSPMSGVVKEIKLEEGSFANPGTIIASIVDINKLKLIVKVDEKDIVKIKNGQKVEIETEVYPNVIFKGQVSQIGVQTDAARKYEVAIEIPNSKTHPLKAGMYGTVKIPIANNSADEMVMIIPRKSVVGSLKKPQVYLAQNGHAILTDIEVGETIGENVTVLSGLDLGTEIITTGQINLENGRAIRIITPPITSNTNNQ
ncbi:efflux RND transporter periplasmic adaptor subunit [Membranihabitans marinus]|uniref:efflux RND transporter periplasmic adaptor subunit n=1 Tax=Membranihabitans marinus TaxID=1227546 RepID=UPI001F00E570|nr:efflux RND transporter periplasmic adaptor subunit [Membranihabitans marinus]